LNILFLTPEIGTPSVTSIDVHPKTDSSPVTNPGFYEPRINIDFFIESFGKVHYNLENFILIQKVSLFFNPGSVKPSGCERQDKEHPKPEKKPFKPFVNNLK